MQVANVSIIIPTFGRNNELYRAIVSVLNQTSSIEKEIIVVDDNVCVTDSASVNALIKDINDNSLRLIKNCKSKGLAGATNSGIKSAKYQWVAFLDDDDEWLSSKLTEQIKIIESEDGPVVCDTGFYVQRLGSRERVVPALKGQIFKSLLVKHRGRAPKKSTVMCLKHDLDRIGGFDESLATRTDLDVFIRLSKFRNFVNSSLPLAVVDKSGEDRMSLDLSLVSKGYRDFLFKYWLYFLRYPFLGGIFFYKLAVIHIRSFSKILKESGNPAEKKSR